MLLVIYMLFLFGFFFYLFVGFIGFMVELWIIMYISEMFKFFDEVSFFFKVFVSIRKN